MTKLLCDLEAGKVVIMSLGARPDAIHPILPTLTLLHDPGTPCHASCISSPTLRRLARLAWESARRKKRGPFRIESYRELCVVIRSLVPDSSSTHTRLTSI